MANTKALGRLAEMGQSIWHWLKSRLGVGVIISALLSIGLWIFDKANGDRIYHAGQHFIAETVPSWGRQPIGAFWLVWFVALGLWIAFWIAFVLLKAYRETRPPKPKPTPEPKPTTPPPLSSHELSIIDTGARVFWRKIGNDTTGYPVWILRDMIPDIAARTKLAPLLWQPTEDLQKSRERVNYAVGEHSQVPLAEVIARLDTLFCSYLLAVRYMHECEDSHGVMLANEPYAERYSKWQAMHAKFMEQFSDLSLRAGYSGLRDCLSRESPTDVRFPKVKD
jgi:hypothetical protein